MNDIERVNKSIARFEAKAEKATDGKSAMIFDEIITDLYDLRSELQDEADRLESEAPRRAAEARLAYHRENDTLDLY